MSVNYVHHYTMAIIVGVSFGILARLQMLRSDYRQYPTFPHGKIIHISLGVIAAGLGAVAVPSLFDKNYTAITFLALAAQQFRDVRNRERESLAKIDSLELVPRGAAYIEGIAMVFEGRNYLVIFTAFLSSLFAVLFQWYWGALSGILALALSHYYMSGKSISHIAAAANTPVRLTGPDLYVGDIYIMNVGLVETRKIIQAHGRGIIVTPNNKDSRVTLSNLGQRQALLYDISTILGVHRDQGEPSLIPMAKLNMDDGRLALFFLPTEKDPDLAIEVCLRTPLLESAVRMPARAKRSILGNGR